MNPRVQIAAARTPGGGELVLYRHDRDFSITINGEELMHSRQHESELELARLGCAHLSGSKAPRILIGGLGMGFTLRQALDLLCPQARVVVGELSSVIVEWNRSYLGELNHHPLKDERVYLAVGDVVALISRSKDRFDAILLDIDNGPDALSDPRNHRLYGPSGLLACRGALRNQGSLAVWSAAASPKFERLLSDCGFHLRRFRVPAYRGSKSRSRVVWVASQDRRRLPRGGRFFPCRQ
jgi:spermidine synthase